MIKLTNIVKEITVKPTSVLKFKPGDMVQDEEGFKQMILRGAPTLKDLEDTRNEPDEFEDYVNDLEFGISYKKERPGIRNRPWYLTWTESQDDLVYVASEELIKKI